MTRLKNLTFTNKNINSRRRIKKTSVAGNAFTGEYSFSYIMSLKNGYHQLLNSLKVSISINEIVNTQTLHNLKIHYILSSWSDANVNTIGRFINFCVPNNPDSEEYYSAANSNG